jgi:hypothetical protein
MSDLIPLLWELNQGVTGQGVPVDFVPAFVALHQGRTANGHSAAFAGAAVGIHRGKAAEADWRAAQSHWEVVVARVLDTDIVKPNESGEVAIRRAVRASALLLNKMARLGRCPICPQPAMVSSH